MNFQLEIQDAPLWLEIWERYKEEYGMPPPLYLNEVIEEKLDIGVEEDNNMDVMVVIKELGCGLSNIVTKEEVCNCDFHQGTLVRQVKAVLPNGVPFVIQKDKYGYAFSMGGSDFEYNSVNKIQRVLLEAVSL
jgi:hypothetical protein